MLYCIRILTRLHSRRPLRNLVATLPPEDNTVPEQLIDFITEWSEHLPEAGIFPVDRRQWVQLNRLRSQAGRFAANMLK